MCCKHLKAYKLATLNQRTDTDVHLKLTLCSITETSSPALAIARTDFFGHRVISAILKRVSLILIIHSVLPSLIRDCPQHLLQNSCHEYYLPTVRSHHYSRLPVHVWSLHCRLRTDMKHTVHAHGTAMATVPEHVAHTIQQDSRERERERERENTRQPHVQDDSLDNTCGNSHLPWKQPRPPNKQNLLSRSRDICRCQHCHGCNILTQQNHPQHTSYAEDKVVIHKLHSN